MEQIPRIGPAIDSGAIRMAYHRPPAMIAAAIILSLLPAQTTAAERRIAPFVTVGEAPSLDRSAVEKAVEDALELVPSLRPTWPAVGGATAVATCGVDAACLGQVASDTGADLGLAIVVLPSGDGLLLTVRTFDTSGGKFAPIVSEAKDDSTLIDEVKKAVLTACQRADHEVYARAMVRVTPPGAMLSVDQRPIQPGAVLVTPGRHVFRALHDGYEPGAFEVEIQRGETATVDLRLVEEEGSFLSSPVTWGVVGGAVVVAGVVTVLAVALSGPSELTILHGAESP